MGIISVFMILICIMSAMNGYRRGFTKTVISMISFLAIIILVAILNPLLTNIVDNYTDIGKNIEVYCMDAVSRQVSDVDAVGRNEQITLIENLPIPEGIRADLLENNNHVIYEILGIADFLEYMVVYLSKILLQAIVFMVSAVLAWIITKIVGLCISGASRMPIVGSLNKMGGLVIGFFGGLIIIWFLFLIVTIFSGTDWGVSVQYMIRQDLLADYVYQKNPFVWLLIAFLLI